MRIIVADINPEICHVAASLGYETYHGPITDLVVDAVVSPANSFGFMDGGVDRHYTFFFGDALQRELQRQIADSRMGELLVGQSMLISTRHEKIPFLISAPTMRVPMRIHDPYDIVLASKAAVIEATNHEFESVAFPGMGTGVGGLSPLVAVNAFHTGVLEVTNPREQPNGFAEAMRRHYALSDLEE